MRVNKEPFLILTLHAYIYNISFNTDNLYFLNSISYKLTYIIFFQTMIVLWTMKMETHGLLARQKW